MMIGLVALLLYYYNNKQQFNVGSKVGRRCVCLSHSSYLILDSSDHNTQKTLSSVKRNVHNTCTTTTTQRIPQRGRSIQKKYKHIQNKLLLTTSPHVFETQVKILSLSFSCCTSLSSKMEDAAGTVNHKNIYSIKESSPIMAKMTIIEIIITNLQPPLLGILQSQVALRVTFYISARMYNLYCVRDSYFKYEKNCLPFTTTDWLIDHQQQGSCSLIGRLEVRFSSRELHQLEGMSIEAKESSTLMFSDKYGIQLSTTEMTDTKVH